MKPCAIVVEGPDDLAAVRALVRHAGARVEGSIHAETRSPLMVTMHASTIPIYAARGKKLELPQRVLDAAAGTALLRPDVVAVCFDPDDIPEASEFAFFAENFETARGARAGALDANQRFEIAGRSVQVLPAPWRLEAPVTVDPLPPHQNLERVLLTGVLRALDNDARAAWVVGSLASLTTIVTDHGWKRAFRLSSAALRPAEAFVDSLLQQPETKEHCLSALVATKAWAVLSAMLAA
jgi:hypothetical protein